MASRRELRGKTTTVREFTGGWNTVDNEFNMSPRYARILRNAIRQPDGTIGPRWGTEWFASIESLGIGKIINIEYYATYIVGATDQGNLFAVDGQGTIFEIWNSDIAASLPSAPIGWSACSFVSFTPFKGQLVACNGIDKPLIINHNLSVTYLADAATGSNVNTPIGRYAAGAVGDTYGYLVIAGDPLEPSMLHIGAADALGTFFGDPAPNDSVQFDLGPKVVAGDPTIKGLRFFRDRLIVGFNECVLAVQLGVYNTDNDHTPQVTDVIEGFGCVSHRTMFPVKEDIYVAANTGAHYITRAKLSSSLVGEESSELIQPELQRALQPLSEATLEDRVFAVQNHNEDQWMLFIPNDDNDERTTESKGFVYVVGREGAWSEMRDWNWRAGCRTLQNNIFFASDYDIYRYGNESNPLYRDYIDDQETWTDGTKFTDSTGWTPTTDDSGIGISWVWELPWADFDQRMTLKRAMFLGLDASGSGSFTVNMFIDDVYFDPDDVGEAWTDGTVFTDDLGWRREQPLLAPALSQTFIGGSQGGFGQDAFGNLFGGGLRTNTPKLYRWPARFKIAKLRFEGDTMAPLRIAAFSITYTLGSVRR